MHLHRGAFSHGGSGSYGGQIFTAPDRIMHPSPGFEAPARLVENCGAGRWREDGGNPTRKVHRPTVVAEAGGASVKRGGQRDMRQLFPGLEIGRRDPPPSHRGSAFIRTVPPGPGQCVQAMMRPPMTRDLRSSRRVPQEKIQSISRYGAPQESRTVRSRRGFLPEISLA